MDYAPQNSSGANTAHGGPRFYGAYVNMRHRNLIILWRILTFWWGLRGADTANGGPRFCGAYVNMRHRNLMILWRILKYAPHNSVGGQDSVVEM